MKSLWVLFALLFLKVGAFGSSEAPTAGVGEHLAAVELAQSVSEITGTAISPLLGVSSVGAWRYYRTPEAHRSRLPWFCHPIAWTGGFVLLSLCFLKDLFGTAVPTLLKKPFDYLELFENKLSAIVASSAFVPIIAAELARHAFTSSGDGTTAVATSYHAAAIVPAGLTGAGAIGVTVAVAVSAFSAVFLASHAINVLIALSPFTILDAGLKLLKLGLLSVVTASAFLSPWISLGICLVIVVIAALIAPWAFRFSLFGTVFAWDTVRARLLRGKRPTDLSRPRCFTARGFADLPVRTLGRVSRTDTGGLSFHYHPWLFLPKRSIPFPSKHVALAKGILCPVLLHRATADESRARDTLLLLPRYSPVEEIVAEQLGVQDLRDGTVVGGLKAVRAWVGAMFGAGASARPGTA